MTQLFFDGRELFQTQVPYYEPDKVTPVYAATVREMLHVALVRAHFNLTADAEVVSAIKLFGGKMGALFHRKPEVYTVLASGLEPRAGGPHAAWGSSRYRDLMFRTTGDGARWI